MSPNVYRQATAGEDERRRKAWETLQERLAAWRERRDEPKLLASFLDRSITETAARLRDLENEKTRPEPAPLLLISQPVRQVRKHYQQPADRRRLLGLAWEAGIAEAEQLPASKLSAALKDRQIDVEQARPDLSDLIEILPLDDRQWAAKMALAEYAILGKPRFQGAGGTLVREDSEQGRPAMGALIAELAKSQLTDVLDDLLEPGGSDAAARKNKQRKQAVVRATQAADVAELIGAGSRSWTRTSSGIG